MRARLAFRAVKYIRTITKGNKVWKVCNSMGVRTVIRCFNLDTGEVFQWNDLNRTKLKSMSTVARLVEEA